LTTQAAMHPVINQGIAEATYREEAPFLITNLMEPLEITPTTSTMNHTVMIALAKSLMGYCGAYFHGICS